MKQQVKKIEWAELSQEQKIIFWRKVVYNQKLFDLNLEQSYVHNLDRTPMIGHMIDFLGEQTTRLVMTARYRKLEEYYINLKGELVDTLFEATKHKLNDQKTN